MSTVLRRPGPASAAADPGSVTAVHQFLPALLPGDAVGTHTLRVRDALRAVGLESEIFVEAVHHELDGQARHFSEFRPFAKGSVLLYQLATGSVLADEVFARPEPLVVDYHNLTPPEFFRRWDPIVANALSWGRAQLDLLAPRTALGLADSTYNAGELEESGYSRTAVVPILLDFDAMTSEVDQACLNRLQAAKDRGGADLLFVGRICPNKAQHDLVKVLYAYRRAYDPGARLHLIGRPATDSYQDALVRFIAQLGLTGAVNVVERVSDAELTAYYRAADVLVSVSEHEGFGVPLLEAMHHDVPVVAYASTAVPETCGDGALLLAGKAPSIVAAAVHRVVSDAAVRAALVAAGRRRLDHFALERSRRRLVEALAPVTGVVP